jgi:hypothetical protein
MTMMVDIEFDERGDEHAATLSITHNKNQWSSIRLYNQEEIDMVIDALLTFTGFNPAPKIDEDRKQDDIEHNWEMLREARKEIISDDPDDNERAWEEDEAEDRQRERDRQDEINFKRGVDY